MEWKLIFIFYYALFFLKVCLVCFLLFFPSILLLFYDFIFLLRCERLLCVYTHMIFKWRKWGLWITYNLQDSFLVAVCARAKVRCSIHHVCLNNYSSPSQTMWIVAANPQRQQKRVRESAGAIGNIAEFCSCSNSSIFWSKCYNFR